MKIAIKREIVARYLIDINSPELAEEASQASHKRLKELSRIILDRKYEVPTDKRFGLIEILTSIMYGNLKKGLRR